MTPYILLYITIIATWVIASKIDKLSTDRKHHDKLIKQSDDLWNSMNMVIVNMKEIDPMASKELVPKPPHHVRNFNWEEIRPTNHQPSYPEDLPEDPPAELITVPSPKTIKRQLDKFVIGQDRAKKILAVAASNHYRRLQANHFNTMPIKKSNIMLIGPTGSGKTLLVKTLATVLDVPLLIEDATGFTSAGYVGRNVEELVYNLITLAGTNAKAAKGIIYIDEIDKIAAHEGGGRTLDVNGRSVQQALLKLIEGSEITLPKGWGGTFDSSDVLFIVGGAFDGLSDIVNERGHKASIGFSANVVKEKEVGMELATTRDLIKYGMIPEFIGRIPILATFKGLTKDDLVEILIEPSDAIIHEYEQIFKAYRVDLQFDLDSLEAIAKEAIKRKTGARGLRAILEHILLDLMYEISDNTNIRRITITEKFVREHL